MRKSQRFQRAPAYVAVLSNKPLDEIAPAEVLRRMEVGLNVVPRPYVAAGIQSGDETFRDALIRLRKERRLFVEDTSAVTFITPNLFRATIKLPAEAPVGTYEVDVRLFPTMSRWRAQRRRWRWSRSASSNSSLRQRRTTEFSMGCSQR